MDIKGKRLSRRDDSQSGSRKPYFINNKKYKTMWNCKLVNYICRIVTDKDGKFKFDLLLKSDVLITDGKRYDTFGEASDALNVYLKKIYEYDIKPNLKGDNHLIVNETIFE